MCRVICFDCQSPKSRPVIDFYACKPCSLTPCCCCCLAPSRRSSTLPSHKVVPGLGRQLIHGLEKLRIFPIPEAPPKNPTPKVVLPLKGSCVLQVARTPYNSLGADRRASLVLFRANCAEHSTSDTNSAPEPEKNNLEMKRNRCAPRFPRWSSRVVVSAVLRSHLGYIRRLLLSFPPFGPRLHSHRWVRYWVFHAFDPVSLALGLPITVTHYHHRDVVTRPFRRGLSLPSLPSKSGCNKCVQGSEVVGLDANFVSSAAEARKA